MLWMDVMRGAAILLVILHHTEGQIRANVGTYPALLVVLNDLAAPFRMPLLMMLSGMLLSASLRKRGGDYLQGKVRAIAWPYLLWSFILVGMLVVTGNVPGGEAPLAAFAAVLYDPPTYLWYLAYLLIFYVVALIASPAGKARSLLIPLAIAGDFIIQDENWSRMLFLAAFFFLGDLLAMHWSRISGYFNHPVVLIGAIGLAGWAAAASALGTTVNYQPMWALNIAAVFVPLLLLAKAAARTKVGTPLSKIGEHSIVFYSTHFVFLVVAFNLLERVGFDNALVLAVILATGAVAFGWALMDLRPKLAIVDALFVLPKWGRDRSRPHSMS